MFIIFEVLLKVQGKFLDACGIGDFEEAKSLLEQGASVDAVSAVCCHVFLCMSTQKAGETQHLTAHARTHTHTHTHTWAQVGETALHLSSIHHNMQLAKYLIEKGAALNARAYGER